MILKYKKYLEMCIIYKNHAKTLDLVEFYILKHIHSSAKQPCTQYVRCTKQN